jgi:hypothetical protein
MVTPSKFLSTSGFPKKQRPFLKTELKRKGKVVKPEEDEEYWQKKWKG